MNADLTPEMVEQVLLDLNLPIEVQALALNRTALVEENKLFQAQLNRGLGNIASLSSSQLARLQAANSELDSRVQAADLEVQQLEKQLRQNEVQLADSRQQLIQDEIVLAEIENRNEQAITQATHYIAILKIRV